MRVCGFGPAPTSSPNGRQSGPKRPVTDTLASSPFGTDGRSVEMDATELMMLLDGIDVHPIPAWLIAAKVLFPRSETAERFDMGDRAAFKRQQGRAAMPDQKRSDGPDALDRLLG